MTTVRQDDRRPGVHRRPPVRRRRRRFLVALGLLMVIGVGAIVVGLSQYRGNVEPVPGTGTVESAPPGVAGWRSGAFVGRGTDVAAIERMGNWRGKPLDTVTVYPNRKTWDDMTSSTWIFTELSDFPGTLVYGLPLVPEDGSATLAEVGIGQHDAVFAELADQMRDNDRGDTVVRVGWEPNGGWFEWSATADTAADWRAAARRVMQVMKERTPTLQMSFEIACNTPLEGTDERLAPLQMLYPGDDVTDLIGCDHYDNYAWQATSEEGWQNALRSYNSPGLQDVVEFAREQGKRFVVNEWGLDGSSNGAGDNPLFIRRMHDFFVQNADVLAYEAYFDEPDNYIKSSIWADGKHRSQNPEAAAEYRRLWGTRSS